MKGSGNFLLYWTNSIQNDIVQKKEEIIMKKVVSIVLTIIMVFGVSFTSYAMDFNEYSNEELIVLSREVAKELFMRKVETTVHLEPGEYIIGTDIPAAEYMLTISNRNGIDDVEFNYTSNSESTESRSEIVQIGCTLETTVLFENSDILSITGPFDLMMLF